MSFGLSRVALGKLNDGTDWPGDNGQDKGDEPNGGKSEIEKSNEAEKGCDDEKGEVDDSAHGRITRVKVRGERGQVLA